MTDRRFVICLEDLGPLATGDLLRELMDAAEVDCLELAAAVLWRLSPEEVDDVGSLPIERAFRWAWEYGVCTTRSSEIDAKTGFDVLIMCTQWCWHWVRRGRNPLCDPVWVKKGSDVMDFLCSKAGENIAETIYFKHLPHLAEVGRDAQKIFNHWRYLEDEFDQLEEYWERLGPETMFNEPLSWNWKMGSYTIFMREIERQRTTGDREPGQDPDPPDREPEEGGAATVR